MGQLPAACLAEEIDTPGDGRIRALVTIAGNPALAIPDSERLQAALPTLDCMISVDNYVNETTQHADVILPGESHLCQPHFSATLYQLAVRHVAKWSDPVFPPDPDRPREWEIMLILSSIFAGRGTEVDTIAADDAIISARIAKEVADEWSPVYGRNPDELFEAMAPAVGPKRVVDWQIRTGPYGDAFGTNPDGWTLARLKQHPHGVDLGPLESRVPEVLILPALQQSREENREVSLAPTCNSAVGTQSACVVAARGNGTELAVGGIDLAVVVASPAGDGLVSSQSACVMGALGDGGEVPIGHFTFCVAE